MKTLTNEPTSNSGTMQTLTTLFRNNIREYGMLIALIAVMVFFQFQTGHTLQASEYNQSGSPEQLCDHDGAGYVIDHCLRLDRLIRGIGCGCCWRTGRRADRPVSHRLEADRCSLFAGRRSNWCISRLLGGVLKNPGVHCYVGRNVDFSGSNVCAAPG